MTFDRKQYTHVINAAVVATAIAILGNHGFSGRPAASSILADLEVAAGHRLVEPRLSFQSKYAPFRMREPRERAGTPDRRGRGLLLQAAMLKAPADEAIQNLVLGKWSEAVATFENRGAAADPVDVSAALYMRGITSGSLSDLGKALEVLRSAGDSPAAVFNRALILQQLTDLDAAAREWQRYLEKDSQSGWAEEARRHLAATRVPSVPVRWQSGRHVLVDAAAAGRDERVRELARRYPLGARLVVELELLPAWGDAVLRGNPQTAQRNLNAARVIVRNRPQQDERLLTATIAEIDAAMQHGTGAALAAAYRVYGKGAVALEAGEHESALKSFAEALEHARSHALVEAIVAPAVATAHYRSYDHAAAERVIAAARSRYQHRLDEFIALAARLDWLDGLIRVARGDPSAALRAYERALVGYDRLAEAEYRAAQHVNHADSYTYLGDTERAGMHLRKALEHASMAENPKRLHGILKVGSDFMIDAGAPEAAVAFQNRLVQLARSTSHPLRIADALVSRSAVLTRVGRRPEALGDTAEAMRLMPQITDEPSSQRVHADASAAAAFAHRDADPSPAISSLSTAIELYRTLGMRPFLGQLLLERGRAYTRLGNAGAAEQDFRTAVDELETQRTAVAEAQLRITYLDRADRVFVDLAELLVGHGRVEEAFNLLERSRARELLDRTSGQPVQPMPVGEIAAHLPEDTLLVAHTLGSSSLITFVVSRTGVRAVQQSVDVSRVSALVAEIAGGFDSKRGLPQHTLRELGRLLIDGAQLPAEQRIVFIPDRALHNLPFAALRTPRGYVVEEHTVTFAPSATLAAGAVGGVGAGVARSVLILASAEPPAGFNDLPPLPRVQAEARRVAAHYPASRILAGSDGEAEAILQVSRAYDVLHFGGHTFVDLRARERSALLVGRHGRITAAQIEGEDLSHLRLVVLGGCNTSLGESHHSEGVMSLARSFIFAGVPAVVGTNAAIDDGGAKHVFDDFHTRYVATGDAAMALRETQLRMIRSGDLRLSEPARWSPFHVIQGIAKRERR